MDNSHILNSRLQVFPLSTHSRTHSAVSSVILCSAPVALTGSLSKTPYHLTTDWSVESNQRWFQSPMWKLRHSKKKKKKKLITELLKGILLWLYSPFWIFHRVFVEYSLCLYGPFTDTEKYWGNLKCFYSNLWNSSIRPWEMSSCSKLYSIFLLYLNWNILIHLHDSTALFLGRSFSHRKSAVSKAQPASAPRT